jgi:hypothetical protein
MELRNLRALVELVVGHFRGAIELFATQSVVSKAVKQLELAFSRFRSQSFRALAAPSKLPNLFQLWLIGRL